ncbi:MAG: helix-turn-helix transcriptional regulator [Planctomycetales bacterium]|nr:helix-turn-helix transcriptional regulator [Planctomycetales bacterium]MCA9161867.1 helix-turn-helix transcriptional regulator [Planctomycetales bacterium]MCA9202563.1 helix-turn-helix transcriptional regulator [Planctomycetales bacterium]MCA9210475.1 helix-turn-helix transcriptional regulator [Planctomycetales bacterium]
MPTSVQSIEIEGKQYVILPASDYESLCGRAGQSLALDESDLPPFPKPDKDGRFPALEYTRVSLARDLIRDRKAAGLTQRQLADLAGVRQETISRIESGKHSTSVRTIDRLEKGLAKANKRKGK